MYEIVKTLIDDGLMGPQLAPFTTFGVILFLGLSVLNVLTGADPDDIVVEDDEDDE